MSKDLHLQHLLDEINGYIDNMPLPDSLEYLRFEELCSELVSHPAASPPHPRAQEIDQIKLKIDAVAGRLDREQYARDPGPTL